MSSIFRRAIEIYDAREVLMYWGYSSRLKINADDSWQEHINSL